MAAYQWAFDNIWPLMPNRILTAISPTNSGAGTDLAMIAQGCGIADSSVVRGESEVAQLVADLRRKKGPVFRLVKVMVEKLDFVMPPQDGAHLKDRFRAALLGRA